MHEATNAPAPPELWALCLQQLAQDLPEQQFNTWIRPLVPQVQEDLGKLTLWVANRFKLDWIRAQYSGQIQGLLTRFSGRDMQLELAVTPKEAPVKSSPINQELDRFLEPLRQVVPEESDQAFKTRLNSTLTFDTLIEGSANRMGRAAAMHVASSLGQLYNPLFIYGGVGLGKTHLVHALSLIHI